MSNPKFEDYRVEIRPLSEVEGGGFLVTFPDLPGCMGDGETYEEAIANARDAFAAWIDACLEEGREIPLPGAEGKPAKYVQRLPKSVHQALTSAAAAEGVSVNSLVTVYVADGLARREERMGTRRVGREESVQIIGVGGRGSHVVEQLRALTSAVVLVDADNLTDANRLVARTYQLSMRPGVRESEPAPYATAQASHATTTTETNNVVKITEGRIGTQRKRRV